MGKKTTRERISIKDLENMTHSRFVQTRKLAFIDEEVFGDTKKHVMECDIFDGLAYCPNYQGKEYWIEYPKVSFFKFAHSMAKKVREYNKLEDGAEITPIHSLNSYASLYCNG